MKEYKSYDYGYWEQTSIGKVWRNYDYDPTTSPNLSDYQLKKDFLEAVENSSIATVSTTAIIITSLLSLALGLYLLFK